MELIFPTIEYKQAALDYRQEYFDSGEMVIHGDGGLDNTKTYEDWLNKIQAELLARKYSLNSIKKKKITIYYHKVSL